jgi:hypothetical protein
MFKVQLTRSIGADITVREFVARAIDTNIKDAGCCVVSSVKYIGGAKGTCRIRRLNIRRQICICYS